VTLTPDPEAAREAVRALAAELPHAGWAVKDSFRTLALGALGFRLLFEADWMLAPAPRAPAPPASGLRWRRAGTETELAAWEAAWGESAGQPRVFRKGLLARPEIAILAGVDGAGRVAAGVIANRAEGVVGLTNAFATDDVGARSGEGLAAALACFPGLPAVGYARGEARDRWRTLGFHPLGPLAVWERRT
jgi:hypothetical protein